jgi:hypothetical protein
VEVRNSLVQFVHDPAFRSALDEFARLAPPWPLVVRRRTPSSPPRSPPVEFVCARSSIRRLGRPGPLTAQHRRSPFSTAACRRYCSVVGRPLRSRACVPARPSDLDPMGQTDLTPGQTGLYRSTATTPRRIRSQPPDLDPTDQIRPFALTARFCKKSPELLQICNLVLPP